MNAIAVVDEDVVPFDEFDWAEYSLDDLENGFAGFLEWLDADPLALVSWEDNGNTAELLESPGAYTSVELQGGPVQFEEWQG